MFSNPFGGFDGKGAAGIEDHKILGNILDTGSSAFRLYDLKTAFGPVTGQALFNAGIQFPTTLGSFRLDRAGDSTFTATVGALPSSQPVPTLSEWAMIGMHAPGSNRSLAPSSLLALSRVAHIFHRVTLDRTARSTAAVVSLKKGMRTAMTHR